MGEPYVAGGTGDHACAAGPRPLLSLVCSGCLVVALAQGRAGCRRWRIRWRRRTPTSRPSRAERSVRRSARVRGSRSGVPPMRRRCAGARSAHESATPAQRNRSDGWGWPSAPRSAGFWSPPPTSGCLEPYSVGVCRRAGRAQLDHPDRQRRRPRRRRRRSTPVDRRYDWASSRSVALLPAAMPRYLRTGRGCVGSRPHAHQLGLRSRPGSTPALARHRHDRRVHRIGTGNLGAGFGARLQHGR